MTKRPYSQFQDQVMTTTNNDNNTEAHSFPEEDRQQQAMKNKLGPANDELCSSDDAAQATHKKLRTNSVDRNESSSSDDNSVTPSSPTNIIRLDDEEDSDGSTRKPFAPLPDPEQDTDPDEFLAKLVESICGFSPKTQPALSLSKEHNFFPDIEEERMDAYDMQLVVACRENDVAKLKALHSNENMSVDCCNRFGESLLHMACRRGFQEMTEFLLEDAELSVRIRDDYGRTPFHDACWNPTPQLEMCKLLLQRDPTLLLVTDKRGSTPFQYARPQHWPTWRRFLLDHCHYLEALVDVKEIFS